jgi:hypothetical protein
MSTSEGNVLPMDLTTDDGLQGFGVGMTGIGVGCEASMSICCELVSSSSTILSIA